MPTAVRPTRSVPDAAELVALGRAQGLDAVGVAPATAFATTRRHLERRRAGGLHGGMAFTYRAPARSCDPAAALPGAQALVVAALGYRRVAPPALGTDPALVDPAAGAGSGAGRASNGDRSGARTTTSGAPGPARPAGRVARYAWDDHYRDLRVALTVVAGHIRSLGWRARVVADDNALVDREAAYRAGLGWYGKNANLLLPGQGSWFVLGSVITDAPVPPTGPRVEDGCGTCTRCLDGCPTGAIVGPGVVDARRCLAWLLQVEGAFPRDHRVALGNRLYGCDDCQEVCPPNRRQDRVRPALGAGAAAQVTVDLLDLLSASDAELLDRHGRWYIPRRQARYLRRNALVVLGNVADPADPAVAAALRRALVDPDPIVRGHAVWAARRLGRDDLVAAAGLDRGHDPDPDVRAELTLPVPRR